MDMKARLAVTRFSNEDVIATSGYIPGGGDPIVVPEGICPEIGTVHFFATGRGVYNAASNTTTAPGVGYMYNAPGNLVPNGSTSLTVAGQVSIRSGRFYYFDGQGYLICDPQAHAR